MKRHATNPWVVLVLICFAQFMVVLDATVVNVALPSIQKDLGMTEANLQWVVNAYTLVFGGFLLLGGRAGDLLGRKRLFLGGVVVFTAASLLDGLSTSSGMLIGARALQGLGAAFISPAALAIISTTFKEGSDRAKALGVWAAIAIGGSAVGLVLGGALTQAFSWPWIFFINVPVGIAVFFFSTAARARVEGRGRAPELRHPRGGHRHRRPDDARLRNRPDRAEGLGLDDDDRHVRHRGRVAPRLRVHRAAGQGAARPAVDLPRTLAERSERRHVPRHVGALRDVLLQLALHPARAGLRAAEGGSRLPAVHRRDHGLGRPRLGVRAAGSACVSRR